MNIPWVTLDRYLLLSTYWEDTVGFFSRVSFSQFYDFFKEKKETFTLCGFMTSSLFNVNMYRHLVNKKKTISLQTTL